MRFSLIVLGLVGYAAFTTIERRTFEKKETVRLRAHFVAVERELMSQDVSSLTAAQRGARAEQIAQLRRYAARGEFPRNEYLPGRVPFFRDSRGNLCAMAFLIAASGRGDIVDHVARTRNNAYVPALADEPGLAAWLDRHGLALAEAARIQPTYGGGGGVQDEKPSSGYVVATVLAGAVSAVSMTRNARSMDRLIGHRSEGFLGLAAGSINLALGLAYVGKESGSQQALGVVNLFVGAGAMILGARALSAKPRTEIAGSGRLRLVPIVAAGASPRVGFAAHLRI